MKTNICYQGDCLEVMKGIEDKSVDSIVTDPPYGLGFMGKSWDNTGIANNVEMWKECLRVLKPGGHLLAFSGTRTYHRMTCAIEDAGFEVRDMIEWVYGSGFPKSLNIGKAVDKLQGNERTPYERPDFVARSNKKPQRESQVICGEKGKYTKGTSEWEGWGTALKPSHEPIVMARKPLAEKTVAENCLKWGTGGINIDESRVESKPRLTGTLDKGEEIKAEPTSFKGSGTRKLQTGYDEKMLESNLGRFPANLIHDNSEEVRECFPDLGRSSKLGNNCKSTGGWSTGLKMSEKGKTNDYSDSGNASRFFKSIIYQAKASKSERNKNTNNYLIIEICVDNMEVAQLQPKVILEKTELWFTELFGKEKMEEYQMDFKSTIKTETKKTTILIILNYSQHLNIKEYIVGAIKTKMESGGNHAVSVENTNEWRTIITDGLMEYLLGVNPVVYPTQLKIRVNANNFHSTVKPIALMEYLIKMVTPKGGIVLDPFAGSGSTLVAAKQNGFQYIGIELTEEYIPIIEARLNALNQYKLL